MNFHTFILNLSRSDRFIIVGGPEGIYVVNQDNNSRKFMQLHPRRCKWLALYQNQLVSVSGSSSRAFQHNLLIALSEITSDKVSGTWKNVITKINAKLPDNSMMQDLSVRNKIASVKIAHFKVFLLL